MPSASGPRALIEVAIAPMARLLNEAGYRKKGRNFSKVSGASVAILNVQASQLSRDNSARFTINLGSYIPSVSSLANGSTVIPSSYEECSWFSPIGFIMPSRNDKWWTVSSELSPGDIAEEVVFDVQTFAMPWLERNFTVGGLVESLRISGSRGAADLLWKLGKRQAAVECIGLVPQNTASRATAVQQWLKDHSIEP